MKNKRLLTLIGSVCLVLVLFIAGCAAPTPVNINTNFWGGHQVDIRYTQGGNEQCLGIYPSSAFSDGG